MPLFQKSVLAKQLQNQDKSILQTQWNVFKNHFQNLAIQNNIRNSKEEQYQGEFLIDLFVNVLGYTKNPTPDFTLTTEYKNVKDSKKADGAILVKEKVKAVIELKGTNTTDLNKIETQAFGYKNNQPDCVYVITSNFEKLRFYIDNATEHLEFNLFTLSEKEFELLYLCMAYENIANDVPKKLKEESIIQEKNITKFLYSDYSLFKRELHKDLVEKNPGFDPLELFQKSQKLLDRFLFIFFAEDRNLLPTNLIFRINKEWRQLQEMRMNISLYDRYKIYFNDLNTGAKVVLPAFSQTASNSKEEHQIFAYNGGLFQPDAILDSIVIDDELLFTHTQKLSEYDFESEIDVNILGHIFENSLNELDEIKTQLEGGIVDKSTTKRKKDGVFYTPKYITKYIVDNTVAKLCNEKKAELKIIEEDYVGGKKRTKTTKQPLLEKLTAYRNWLLQITICDPACGSGAFLNQALDFLIAEHRYIDELQAKLFGDAMVLSDVEKTILENNLYGVDLNEESVEIAKLSLWLRTAQKDRKLNDLSSNIKCGNSLIDDPAVAGEKAFNWQAAFPKVFEKGGFDVIIGNPPYGAKIDLHSANFLVTKYPLVPSKLKDTYLYFILLSIEKLKSKGILGLIIPNTWLLINNTAEFRKHILSHNISHIIDHGDNVFEDAIVESSTIILTNEIKEKGSVLAIKQRGAKEIINHHVDKSNWLDDELNRIVIELSATNHHLISKIEKNTKPFEYSSEIIFGIKPYQVGHGIPSQTREMVNNRIYHSNTKIDDNWFPLITGTNINRYKLDYDESEFILYGKNLMYASNESKIRAEKILLRRTSHDLRAYIDSDFYYPQNSLFIITSKYNLKYLLSLINSKLFDFIYKAKCPQVGKVFAEVKPSIIKSLPIKDIPSSKQEPFINNTNLILLLTKHLQEQSQKFQRTVQRKFEIDALPKKLQDWYTLSYGGFIKELGKLKIKLSLSQEAEWEEYFLTEAKKAKELKAQIDTTDKTIDAMVYELYGLTPEEIAIIENS